MTQEHRKLLEKYAAWYETELTDNILPFWLKHGLDPVHGGVYTCLHRDGTVAQAAKGNLFKGPFHIPRMLVKAGLLCREILLEEGIE